MYHRQSYQASDIPGEIAIISTGKRLISRINKELYKNSFKELLTGEREEIQFTEKEN